MRKKRAVTCIDDGMSEETRTTLIQSLAKMLGEGTSSLFPALSTERLREVDIELAHLGRKRRSCLRTRRFEEGALEEIEGVIGKADGVSLQQLSSERDAIVEKLEEAYLSLAECDRKMRGLRVERKRIESQL